MNRAVIAEEAPDTAPVNAGDRLSFTLFLALVIHGILLLGITFTLPPIKNASPTIEVTLATHKVADAPKEADFLAQNNQDASGTLDEAKQLSTDQRAEFADIHVRDINPMPQMRQQQEAKDASSVITAVDALRKTSRQENPEQEILPEEADQSIDSPIQYDAEIASLQAKMDRLRQESAKRPRLRVINSVSARESFDAQYLNSWSSKIERISEQYYPQEAISRRITGAMRLSVIINADGSVHEISVLNSSGHRMLDDAARQIVRRAAPFDTFSTELRRHADRLQIIRTWNFEILEGNTSITTSAR